MSWKILYSGHARQDLQSIYDYIAWELYEPVIAENTVKRILEAARTLQEMPMRYRLWEEEPWKKRGLRCLSVQKYMIFYIPENDTVKIIRILYSGRDLQSVLSETDPAEIT